MLFQSTDISVQKKAYRLFEEIVSSESTACRNFVNSNRSDLLQLHLEGLKTSMAASKPVSLLKKNKNLLTILSHFVIIFNDGNVHKKWFCFIFVNKISSNTL